MSYFGNIKEAVVSIAKGMAVTIRTFVKTPDTIQYPEQGIFGSDIPGYTGRLKPLDERYRGILTVDPESCVVDNLCARVCPVNCIKIEGVKGPKTKAKNLIPGKKDLPKTRYPVVFDIHIGRCLYCGLCVEACNTGAIHFTREFRGQTQDYGDFIRRFVSDEEAQRLNKMAEEEAERAAKEKAAKEKEAAEKAAAEDKPEPAGDGKPDKPEEGGE